MTRYDMMMRGGYSSLEEMDEAYRKEEAGAKQRLAVMRAKGGLKMTDYISREEVLEHSEYTENFNLVVPVRFIKAMKAADVQTVKHGRWIKCDYKRLDDAGEVQTYIGQGVYCSKCRTGFHKNEVKNWIGCPCCLTRMDGDTNG